MSSRRFALLSVAGFAILYTGPALIVFLMTPQAPRAPDLALALLFAGFLLMVIGLAPLFTRFLFWLWAERGLISSTYQEPAFRRRVADVFAIILWVVWLAGALICVTLAWEEMRASLNLG